VYLDHMYLDHRRIKNRQLIVFDQPTIIFGISDIDVFLNQPTMFLFLLLIIESTVDVFD